MAPKYLLWYSWNMFKKKKGYKRPRFENKIKYLISFLLGCHELTCVVLVLAPTTNVNFSIKTWGIDYLPN